MQRENRLHKIKWFTPFLSESLDHQDDSVWADIDLAATKIAAGEGYGPPIAALDFHIFMGVGLDDEMEAVIRAPVVVTVHGSVGVSPYVGRDLGFEKLKEK